MKRPTYIRPPQPGRDFLRLPMVRVVILLIILNLITLTVLYLRGLS